MKGNVIAGLTRNPLGREIPDRVRDDKGGMTREVRDDVLSSGITLHHPAYSFSEQKLLHL